MKHGLLLAAVGCFLAWACGGESSGGDDGSGGGPGARGGAPGNGDVAELCRQGCEATLSADCANGPATQAECEEDCSMFDIGPCQSEYRALVTCAEGKTVACTAGFPTVPGCETEQAAFAQCL